MNQKQNQQNYNRDDGQPYPPVKKKNNLKVLASFLFLLTAISALLIIFYESVQNANTNPNLTGSDINISDYSTGKKGSNNSSSTYSVVIDAGHGGFDTGKVGSSGNYNEDILNLAVAKKLGDALQKLGITPIYTRSDENALGSAKQEDMQKRVDITNQSGADLFVSIHMNSFPDDTSINGPEVYYFDSWSDVSKSGVSIAKFMQQELNKFSGGTRKSRHEDLMVIRESKIPAILIECGYLSNKSDEIKLNNSEYQDQLANIIAESIKSYLY